MPLSQLTDAQQAMFHDRLKELRMDPSMVVASITPETHQGPVILSADDTLSSVRPHLVTVTSLDEVKRLAGNSDEDYDSGKLEHHHEIQEEWPAELNEKDPAELHPRDNRRINAAEMAYIYGHSKHHSSYKTIIERHKYPATFAVFAVEDLCLDATNSPLVIKSESASVYGTITICEGGWIEFEANAVMTVAVMNKSTASSCAAATAEAQIAAKDV